LSASYICHTAHITRGEQDHGSSLLDWRRVLERRACVLSDGAHAEHFHANYSGVNEVGALNAETGAISSNGTAALDLDLNERARALTFKLTFADLSSPVTQAHIHFGQPHVPGNVMVFFCTNLNNGPAGRQACPANGGTATGTITTAGLIAVPAQGVPANDFAALEGALECGSTYGNIHTTNFPAGELRGNVHED